MVVFDFDPTAAAATRNQLFSRLAREDVWVAEPHTSSFPGLGGRLPQPAEAQATLHFASYLWQHCRGLYQTPIAA